MMLNIFWRLRRCSHIVGAPARFREELMLDFVGTVVSVALMVFVTGAVITFIEISRGAKLALSAVVGAWIGLCAASASAGWIAISRPFPVIGVFVATPLVAAVLASAWPAARAA